MAVHIPIIAHTRHSIPTMPFLSVFAAVALVSMWRARRAGVSGGAPHAGA